MAELKQKMVLKEKGDTANVIIKNVAVTLAWRARVDLDLFTFYRAKDNIEAKKGFLGFGKVTPGQEGKVCYMSKGSLSKFPWMKLDKDAGVGDVGGDNQENLTIAHLDEIEHLLIAVNIFNKPDASFASYDGRVILRTDNQEIEVPLTAKKGGNWCVVAHVDNSNPIGARLININQTQQTAPKISDYV